MEILIIILVAFLLIVIGSIPTIKYFMDKGKVRIIIAKPERELQIAKIRPKENLLEIDGKTFDLDKEKFIVYKGMPTYFYNFNNTVPLDPYSLQITEYTPELYNAGLESKIVRDIIDSSKKQSKLDLPIMTLLIGGITLVGLGIAVYLLNDKLTSVQEQLNTLLEILEGVGIGGVR